MIEVLNYLRFYLMKDVKEKMKENQENFDKISICNNKERFNNYISNAQNNLRYFEQLRITYFEINLVLTTILITLLSIFIDRFNSDIKIIILLILLSLHLIPTVSNIIYCLLPHYTKIKDYGANYTNNKKFWSTLWFHDGNMPKEEELKNDKSILTEYLNIFANAFIEQNVNKNSLIRDDVKSIYVLFLPAKIL